MALSIALLTHLHPTSDHKTYPVYVDTHSSTPQPQYTANQSVTSMTLGIMHHQGGRGIALQHLLHHVLINVGGQRGPVHPTRVDIETGGKEKYG